MVRNAPTLDLDDKNSMQHQPCVQGQESHGVDKMLVLTAFPSLGIYNVWITQMADSIIGQLDGGAWCRVGKRDKGRRAAELSW